MEQNSTVRIRTTVDATKDAYYLPLPLEQTYDTIEILSLKLDQKNDYKYYQSPTGVIVGRVYANGGFGVQNAAVSVFVEVGNDDTVKQRLLYNYTAINDTDNNGVRYNILESEVDDACHQDVGTFPSKRRVLDNGDVIEMFDKYYSITTRTNASGDYMLTGIPSNSTVTLHMDCDLSDIGLMSQRPRDLVYKGYDINLFDNPNKFKKDENLNSLTQIITQNKSVYVYPYFAESTSNEDGSNVGITRVDFDLNYKIEPTCVFMGSVVTDKGNNAINEKCRAADGCGKNDSLIAAEGTIEMIRKRPDGKVEEFQIKGNQLIDGDGVWCYQIPMNLDYVTTDEYGNLVPTEDPDRGIPTRTRVRFRIGVSETPEDGTARKRCKYLVPNNPRIDSERFPVFTSTLEPDYEFGSNTSDESFKDLFWNNVYTVKNYIPQLQTQDSHKTRRNTGIKWINHYGDNNPFPFNALTVRLSFTYRIICIVVKIIIQLIELLNEIMGMISGVFCLLYNIFKGFKKIPLIGSVIYGILYPVIYVLGLIANAFVCIGLSSDFCDDEVNRYTYYPGCGKWPFSTKNLPKNMRCIQQTTEKKHNENERSQYDSEEEYLESATVACFETATLYTCIENQLAQDNDATSFSFSNDWVNGVLYLPLWYRKIKAKKSFLFGLIKRKAKDQWCSADKTFSSLRLYKGCELKRSEDKSNKYNNFEGTSINPRTTVASNACKKKNCNKQYSQVKKMKGVIVTQETMLGQTVYYYKAAQYSSSLTANQYSDDSRRGEVELLFATDIVLLGSLNECDLHGIPQFFKWLEPTTYNLPNDILDADQDINYVVDASGNATEDLTLVSHTTETGCDWGNHNSDQCYTDKDYYDSDGGLFYGIGCMQIEMYPKTCFNLSRICEFGVSKDVVKKVENLAELQGSDSVDDDDEWLLIPDGYVSYDELYNLDQRSMFATMNANGLKTILNNKTGLREYDFRYLYPENFDGSMADIMKDRQRTSCRMTYKDNYKLETVSKDYYQFRMGDRPYFYESSDGKFPRYENSFYFYFGPNEGKTAIEQFNSQFFSNCEDSGSAMSPASYTAIPNTWCSVVNGEDDGYTEIDLSMVDLPCDIIINSQTDLSYSQTLTNVTDTKIVLCTDATYTTLSDEAVEKGEDYEYAHPDNCRFALPNGNYVLTITDANGDITEFALTVDSNYLEYSTDSVDFTVSNRYLSQTYSDDYDKIANESGNGRNKSYSADEDVNVGIGGVIYVHDIFDSDGETLTAYKVTVYTDEIDYIYPYVIVTPNSSGKPQATAGGSGVLNYSAGGSFVFGMPWGGVTYIVVVTELCKVGDVWVESGNSVKTTVFVDEVEPLKMYINGIDYDLISDWESGWEYTGDKKIGRKTENGVNVVPIQWLTMSDQTNYNWGACNEGEKLCKDILNLVKSYGGTYNGQSVTLKYITVIEDYFKSSDEGGYWWNTDLYTCMKNLMSKFSLSFYGDYTFNEDKTITYGTCEEVAVENDDSVITLTRATEGGTDECGNTYNTGAWIDDSTGCISDVVTAATESGTDDCGNTYVVGDWLYSVTGCKVGDADATELEFVEIETYTLKKATESGTDSCGNSYLAGAWINEATGCVFEFVTAATESGTDDCGNTYVVGDWLYLWTGCKVGDANATELEFNETDTYTYGRYREVLEAVIQVAIAENCTTTAAEECAKGKMGYCEEDCADEEATEPCYDEDCLEELKEDCQTECEESIKEEVTARINEEYAWVINAYNECIEESNSFLTELQSLLDEFQDFKDQTVHDMRTGFTLNCPTDSQNITVTVTGENTPFTVNLAGREEESDYDSSGNVVYTLANKVTNPESWKDTSTVSDIGIPTIAPFDNELYGKNNDGLITYEYTDAHNEKHTEYLCYALDNNSSFKSKYKWKHPYLVACADSTCETLPIDTNTSKKYIWNSFACGKDKDWYRDYFIFHMLYRPFEFKVYAWAYMSDIPYYTTDGGKGGKYVNMMGLVAGYIYNGTPETVVDSTDEPISFETQTFGNYGDLIIKNDDETSEDDLVKKRYIEGINRTDTTDSSSLGNADEDDLAEGCVSETENADGGTDVTTIEPYTYKNFVIGAHFPEKDGTCDDTQHPYYIPLPYEEIDMQIDDESCSITRTAYGRATIEIDSDTLISTNEDECIFKVRGIHCGDNVTYYIFKINDGDGIADNKRMQYPLNSVDFTEISVYDEEMGGYTFSTCSWADMGCADEKWNGINGVQIFSPSTTEEVLKEIATASSNSENKSQDGVNMYGVTEYYDENGNLVTEHNKGYGTTGQFLARDKRKHHHTRYRWKSEDCKGAFFVVGVNSDNTRFISPVYITAPMDLEWGARTEAIEDNKKYYLTLKLVSGYVYYVTNYSFDVDLSCTAEIVTTVTTVDGAGNTTATETVEEVELTIYESDESHDAIDWDCIDLLLNRNNVDMEEVIQAVNSIGNRGAAREFYNVTEGDTSTVKTISVDSATVEITDASGMTYTCYIKRSNYDSDLRGCDE